MRYWCVAAVCAAAFAVPAAAAVTTNVTCGSSTCTGGGDLPTCDHTHFYGMFYYDSAGHRYFCDGTRWWPA